MLVIGDVHGLINKYLTIVKKVSHSIQLGDFGFKKEHDWHIKNISKISNNHKILFGNHDYYPYLKMDHSLNDFNKIIYNNKKIFTIRGADSIDKQYRTEGKDWFRNEEIEYKKWDLIFNEYLKFKPDIVITHDCPTTIKKDVFGYQESTITNQGLQQCLELFEPNLWLFGHYHKSIEYQYNKTLFKCLDELETFEI